MKRIIRTVPVSAVLLVTMWTLFVVFGTQSRQVLGYNLPADPQIWHGVTAGLTSPNMTSLLYLTVAVAAFAAPAERVLGSAKFAVAALTSHAVALPLGFLFGSVVERAGFNRWGPDLTNEVFCSPVAWIFGPLAYTTASLGVLWRRRLRLVMLALTGTLVLYAGSLAAVVALTAVITGWVAGELVQGPKRPVWNISLRESRFLIATLLVVVAVGPVLTAVNPAAQGPLSGLSELMWEPAVAEHQVALKCADPVSQECAEALAINQQHGLGPLVLNLIPLLLTLIVALGVARGRRVAWLLAMALSALSLLVIAVQAAGGSRDLLTGINVFLVVLPWGIVLVVLALTQKRFQVASQWQRAVVPLLGVLGTTALVWVVGALALQEGFLTPPTPRSVFAELPLRYLPPLVGVLVPHYLVPRTALAWGLYEWVGIVFWALVLVLLYRVLTSAPSPSNEVDRALARRVFFGGTGDHLSAMGLWRANRYFFVNDDQCETTDCLPRGYVAYRVSRNVAVTVGAPVWGERSSCDEIATAFEQFVAAQGWQVAWYSVDEDFTRPGFHTLCVAEESLLSTADVEFKGKKFQNIRTARNRAHKEAVSAVWTTWSECDLEMREKITALSEQWVAEKALPEMGFTLGGLEELREPGTKLLLAVGADYRLHAVTSWLPVYEQGHLVGYTLDFMRRDAEGFRPALEFLLAEAAVIAHGEGLQWVSLSGAPLARSDSPRSLVEILLEKTGARIEPLYGFRSLAASKYKFHPTHRAWNLVYNDELALGAIGLAVVNCYLPDLTLSEMTGVVKEFLARRQPMAQGHGEASSPSGEPTSHL